MPPFKAKHIIGAGLIAGAGYLLYKAYKGAYDKVEPTKGLTGCCGRVGRARGVFAVPGGDPLFQAAAWYAGKTSQELDSEITGWDTVNPVTGLTEGLASELRNVQLRGVEPYRMTPVDNMLGRCR